MPKVTINVVAQHAGVSKKTVSRVLNNEANVSEITRKRVLATFDELGYRPSAQARGLATNKSFLIGLIYDNPNKSYVSDIQTGALQVCQQTGYHLLINPVDHESEQLLSIIEQFLKDSRVDGLVLTPPFSDNLPLLEMLDLRQLAYVRIGATKELTRSNAVISDDFEAALEISRYLVSLGHTRFGFIKGHPDHPVSAQRLAGFRQALEENGISIDEQSIVEGDFTFRSGEIAARKLLNLEQRPTAIFASNDFMAAAVLKVASQKQIVVPHDLSVTGFDNAPISRYIWPALTTIRQPVTAMAHKATELLLRQMASAGRADKPNTSVNSSLAERQGHTENVTPIDSNVTDSTKSSDNNTVHQMADELVVRASTAPPKP